MTNIEWSPQVTSNAREQLERLWEQVRVASAAVSTTDFDEDLDVLLAYAESSPELRMSMEDRLLDALQHPSGLPTEVLCYYVHRLGSARVNDYILSRLSSDQSARMKSFLGDLRDAMSPNWTDRDLFPSLTRREP
jgi:hypothetical protein